MTKVYALADTSKRLIIYDGRVGAALALLARKFLEHNHLTIVPDVLRFAWGAARPTRFTKPDDRDPSTPSFKFPRLFNSLAKDLNHASLVASSSRMVAAAAAQLVAPASRRAPKAIFVSLFMIGSPFISPLTRYWSWAIELALKEFVRCGSGRGRKNVRGFRLLSLRRSPLSHVCQTCSRTIYLNRK